MAFTQTCVTSQGASLLASATTSNQIVLDSIRLSTSYFGSSQLQQISASTTYQISGIIESASPSGRYANITGRVNQTDVTTSRSIKSVWIMAHLKNDSNLKSLCAFGMNDSTKYIYIPNSSSGGNGVFRFPFTLYIQNDASQAIEFIDGQYAPSSDLQRFVSLHSAPDALVGDAQSMLGLKTFADGLYVKKPQYQTTGTTINMSTGQQTVIIGLMATVGDVLTVPTSLIRPCTLTGSADSSHYIMGGKYLALSHSPNTTTPLLVVKIPDSIE